MTAALTLAGIVVLAFALAAALVVLVIVAASSTDHRDVRLAIRAVMGVLLMMGALVAGLVTQAGCGKL